MKILKFFRDGCGPCKLMEENLKEAGIETEDVDTDKFLGEEKANEYCVLNVPTLIMVDDEGQEVKRFTGVMAPELLGIWIET